MSQIDHPKYAYFFVIVFFSLEQSQDEFMGDLAFESLKEFLDDTLKESRNPFLN